MCQLKNLSSGALHLFCFLALLVANFQNRHQDETTNQQNDADDGRLHSGHQSHCVDAVVTGALSLDELGFSDIGTVIWKEIRTAALCGIALAAVCFAKIWLVDKLLFGNSDITLMVDLVVCLALAVTVIIAKMVGCMLPLAAKAMKLDPAVMASPFISTIVDALSLLVYFLFAKALLGV